MTSEAFPSSLASLWSASLSGFSLWTVCRAQISSSSRPSGFVLVPFVSFAPNFALQIEIVDQVVEMRPRQLELARRLGDVPVVLLERLEDAPALKLPRGLLQRERLRRRFRRVLRKHVMRVQR